MPVDQCAKQAVDTGKLFGYQLLDRRISELKNSIHWLEVELNNQKSQLKEFERIRKTITPEDEAKIMVLREAGLI